MKTRLTAEWDILVRDFKGNIVKHLTKDADLVLVNWLKLASAFGLPFYNGNYLLVVAEDGSTGNYQVKDHHSGIRFSGTLPSIVVGSNSTPPSPSDYRLGSKWGASSDLTPSFTNPSNDEWDATISFTFSASVPQTLAELGVRFYHSYMGNYLLICRDVLPQPITIPSGGSVTISYTLKSKSGGS
jgi:hypothetical protein